MGRDNNRRGGNNGNRRNNGGGFRGGNGNRRGGDGGNGGNRKFRNDRRGGNNNRGDQNGNNNDRRGGKFDRNGFKDKRRNDRNLSKEQLDKNLEKFLSKDPQVKDKTINFKNQLPYQQLVKKQICGQIYVLIQKVKKEQLDRQLEEHMKKKENQGKANEKSDI